jgi:hypothetical protein
MELYLDSADIKEIDEAFKLGFLTGLTTTPTFMHRGGVTNIDKMILDLAKKVPILQVEALGETAEEVVKEAKRQLKMGLKKETTVFKIPVSLEGLRACKHAAQRRHHGERAPGVHHPAGLHGHAGRVPPTCARSSAACRTRATTPSPSWSSAYAP